MRIRWRLIRHLVSDVLKSHHVSQPPVDVKAIAKKSGLSIVEAKADDKLSGFLARNSATGNPVIGVNPAHHPLRQRFTIAHELGHYLLHEGEMVHVDGSANYRVNLRSSASSLGKDPKEIEANTFAAELLMPELFIRRDLRTSAIDFSDDKVVAELAGRYQVSLTAMSIRLTWLGLHHSPTA